MNKEQVLNLIKKHELKAKLKKYEFQGLSLKYYPRLHQFKAANVKFNPENLQAYSYDWWRFVEKMGPFLVFNNFRYSVSTSKHQNKVSSLLDQLGFETDFSFEAPDGLQNLDSAIKHYERKITSLREEIAKPRSHKAKNDERRWEIKNHQETIKIIKKLNRLKRK